MGNAGRLGEGSTVLIPRVPEGRARPLLSCSSCRDNQWPGQGSGGGLATVEPSARICTAELSRNPGVGQERVR
jgi:hypothetical protein